MTKILETAIEADPKLPVIRMTRDFAATPGQLFRAHTDPALFAQWVGPDGMDTRIDHWDARAGGSWRYTAARGGQEYAFRGCFHDVRPDRIVQTFTFEGDPTASRWRRCGSKTSATVTRGCVPQSLVDSFEGRDAWLASGMESGVNEGYAKLDKMLADGAAYRPAERHRQIGGLFTERVRGTLRLGCPDPGRRLGRPRRGSGT